MPSSIANVTAILRAVAARRTGRRARRHALGGTRGQWIDRDVAYLRPGDHAGLSISTRPRAAAGWCDDAPFVLGPGWQHLLRRLDRRLAADGVPIEGWPRIAITGAGELRLAVPAGASLRTLRRVAAVMRRSRQCCEICLRQPAAAVWTGGRTDRQLGRLCAWHAALVDDSGEGYPLNLATVRMDAWMAHRYGVGALRAFLLGARLSPTGLHAALATYAASLPAEAGETGWIAPALVHHALAQLPVDMLARLTPPDAAPLLAAPDPKVRELGLELFARMAGARGELPRYLAGDFAQGGYGPALGGGVP